MAVTKKDPFASVGELVQKSQGRITAENTDILRELKAASQKIRNYTRWHVWPQVTDTIRTTGDGTCLLLLPTLYLESITSITDDGTTVIVADLDYFTDEFTDGVIERDTYWSTRRAAITATIVHGYTECPEEIKDLTLQIAARALGSPLGATKEQAGAVSVSWSLTGAQTAGGTVILDQEQAELDTYRIPGRT
jgi:hypothetical protein